MIWIACFMVFEAGLIAYLTATVVRARYAVLRKDLMITGLREALHERNKLDRKHFDDGRAVGYKMGWDAHTSFVAQTAEERRAVLAQWIGRTN